MRTTNRKPKNVPEKKDPHITQKRYEALQAKLIQLGKQRPDAAKEVVRLAELGDFSENVEYQLAKRKLRGINNNILHTENQLRQARIISPKKNATTVQLGHTVSILSNGKMKTYTILGSAETNPSKGIISQSSPIGSVLLGKKLGEKITASIADREVEYEIVEII
jgi:transcription elongation factor GreA